MSSILNLFRKSPFEPLYKHRIAVRQSIDLVKPLLQAVLSGDQKEQERITDKIISAERKADELKMEIRRIVPKGVFLPVNREDLLRYLKIQDDLADTAEDIAVLASMKKLFAPVTLADEIMHYVDIVLNVCSLADEATDQLRPLVTAGFKGESAQNIMDLVEKAELAEREADEFGLQLAKKLFKAEDQMKGSDIFLWFKIFGLIGDLADYADKTGELLSNMLSR